MKVLQSIASVIQALPAEQQIPPVEVTEIPLLSSLQVFKHYPLQAIVTPVVEKLLQALRSSAQVGILFMSILSL